MAGPDGFHPDFPDGTEKVLIQDWCGQYSTHSIGAQ